MLVSASIGTLLVTALMDANVASSRMYKQIKEKSDAEWHIRLARTLIRKMPDGTSIADCITELNTKVKIKNEDLFSFAVWEDSTDFYIVVASNVDTEDRLKSSTEIKTDNIYLKTTATPSTDYDSKAIQITSSLVNSVVTPECALLDEDYAPACYEVIDDKNDPKFGQHKIGCKIEIDDYQSLEHKEIIISRRLVAFGLNAGSITAGANNTFIGNLAGSSNTTGANNTFIGHSAGSSNTTGTRNTFIGHKAGQNVEGGYSNTSLGHKAGQNTTGKGNIFLGGHSGHLSTGGDDNIFMGFEAGAKNEVTGNHNIFMGSHSGYSNTTGENNIFLGYQAGYPNKTGNDNTFIGRAAGYYNTTGGGNIFLGRTAGYYNTTGNDNTFLGRTAGYSNKTGNDNTFLGRTAGYSNKTGNDNTFIGRAAGYYNTTGESNIFLGANVGNTVAIKDKSYLLNIGNIIYGNRNKDKGNSETGAIDLYPAHNTIKIRGDLEVTGKVQETLRVNNLEVTGTIKFKNPSSTCRNVILNTDGVLSFKTGAPSTGILCNGITPHPLKSDRSLKKNIKSLENELENLLALKPSMYYWKNKDLTPKKQFGLIAQDVESIYPNLVYKDEDTKKLSLDYIGFIAVIIQSIQEIHKTFGNDVSDLKIGIQDLRLQDKALELKDKKLKDDLELLKSQIEFLKNRINELERR